MRVVYSPHYNIGFLGLERLHPFDSRKYGRAWKVLQRRFGAALNAIRLTPDREVSREALLRVHTDAYLDRLRNPPYVATALEMPPVGRLPRWVLDRAVLRPMRWATNGTVIAARECLTHGLSVNLSGGYHHAKPESGEGFCIYADIPIAIAALRAEGKLDDEARVAYVDLDAHQGNGVCHAFADDPRVFIFDIFNAGIYPAHDTEAQQRIDCRIGVTGACTESEYMSELRERLPSFLDSINKQNQVRLAIYNAGTDVLQGDPLGQLNLSVEAIIERDLFVVGALRERDIPVAMVLSGGYTDQSYQLVADSVSRLLEDHSGGKLLSAATQR